MKIRKIYFGDNLEVMQEMKAGSVNIIATDPPFNSGRNYNIFLPDSEAQNKAFKDTWSWDDTAINTRAWIEDQAVGNNQYNALNRALTGYDHILDHAVKGPRAKIRSYLTFMGPRLVEMHRLLKNTGCLYLHCDSSASHYLKGTLDAIFNKNNFRREIIWALQRPSGFKTLANNWIRNHDVIFYYVKSNKFNFNKQYENYPGKKYPLHSVWSDIQSMQSQGVSAKEGLNYPTQKPRVLYERIIKASSNEGDIVLDPFCGCGTTIDAAEALDRQWLGIDITNLALEPMRKRLRDNHGLIKDKDYQIFGYPTNMQEVQKMLDDKKYHDYANWAIAQIGLYPTKNVGDGGIDGIGQAVTWQADTMTKTRKKIVAEVKSGPMSKTQVRAFCHSMNEFDAIAGVIVTLQPPTKAMREYQEKEGKFEHNGKRYHRLQIWQIDDRYFNDPMSIKQQVKLPWNVTKTSKK